MKKIILIFTAIFLILPGFVFSAQGDLKPQTNCPVMGHKIDKSSYLDYEGQRVYFCCDSCKDKFLKEPDKYFSKFQEEGILLESVQTKCPVMGGKIDKEVFVDYKGRRIYFCCAGCEDKFLKEPGKYLQKIE